MKTRHLSLSLAIALVFANGAAAAHTGDAASLTVYRSDSTGLYASQGDSDVAAGYAVVREQRALTLGSGTQDVVIGDLPRAIDAEALALNFPDGAAQVISQRLLLAQGSSAALTGLVGRQVDVLGDGGETLAQGTLQRAGDGLLVQDKLGRSTLITRYAAVRSTSADFSTGSTLKLLVDAKRAGSTNAVLSYPTSGIGWRAAYVATMQAGSACRMQFESHASIANRSGRDWNHAQLTLIAGEPNMAKASAPRPMMAMARSFTKSASADMPQQDSIGDYRSFTLPAAVDLPDGSVSQVPLYAARSMNCEQLAVLDSGNSFQPQQPVLTPDFDTGGSNQIISTLTLKAFDSLPAGYLRVLTADRSGAPQFIGEGRINDTPKGSDATITLGTSFDLRAERERTSFSVDKAARSMQEAFRITLGNAGEAARTVTVREHPGRWRQWTVVSSTVKPDQQTPDLLEFKVAVPAHGKATLDYAVRYQWTADNTPQP
jgi:hypothetical protein